MPNDDEHLSPKESETFGTDPISESEDDDEVEYLRQLRQETQ